MRGVWGCALGACVLSVGGGGSFGVGVVYALRRAYGQSSKRVQLRFRIIRGEH